MVTGLVGNIITLKGSHWLKHCVGVLGTSIIGVCLTFPRALMSHNVFRPFLVCCSVKANGTSGGAGGGGGGGDEDDDVAAAGASSKDNQMFGVLEALLDLR